MLNQTLCSRRQAAKPSDTDRQPAFRPLVAQPYGSYLHASPTAPCRNLRHDPDSGTRFNHPAHRIEARHARSEVQCRAQPCGVPNDMPLKRTLARQTDERAIKDIDQGQNAFACNCIPSRNDNNKPIVAERKLLDVVGQRGDGGNANVRHARTPMPKRCQRSRAPRCLD
jgi:hypothetical protein